MGLLDNTVGIVTGEGGGIGRSISLIAAREGEQVVAAAINSETCEEIGALIPENVLQ